MKQELHMITGKGGVGKSVVALALAQKLAQQSGSTLLVELGEQSYYGPLLGMSVDYKPRQLRPGLDISIFSGESCLREYVSHLVKVPKVAGLFFDNKVMRAFVKAAPGLNELAILGKLTSGIREWGPEFNYRHIVVDCYSSGHFLALLRAPMGLAEIIDVGPMGEQSRAIFRVLQNPALVHYQIVTLPEEMPVTESMELEADIRKLTGVQPKLLVNRGIAEDSGASELSSESEWQLSYKQYFERQNQKIGEAMRVLEQSKIPYHSLPFIYDVSAKGVAEKLSEEGALVK